MTAYTKAFNHPIHLLSGAKNREPCSGWVMPTRGSIFGHPPPRNFLELMAKLVAVTGNNLQRLFLTSRRDACGAWRRNTMDDWPDFGRVDWKDVYPRLLLATVGRLRRSRWRRACEMHATDFVQTAIEKAMSRQRSWDPNRSCHCRRASSRPERTGNPAGRVVERTGFAGAGKCGRVQPRLRRDTGGRGRRCRTSGKIG